jgi:uncharacterized protein YrrD
MRRGTDLINKPIVTFDTGEVCGRVKDLIFDQNRNVLMAFLIEESKFLSSAKVLQISSVQSVGADAVITATKDNIISVSNLPDVATVLEHNNILRGTHIMTVDGRDLGRMIDLYFDEKTGLVEGYEVSGGLFADAYSGRSFVPAVETVLWKSRWADSKLQCLRQMKKFKERFKRLAKPSNLPLPTLAVDWRIAVSVQRLH